MRNTVILFILLVCVLYCGTCFIDTSDAFEISWKGGERLHQSVEQIFASTADDTVSLSEEVLKPPALGAILALAAFHPAHSFYLTSCAQRLNASAFQDCQFLCVYRL